MFVFFLRFYLFMRERERTMGRGRERRRGKQIPR